jgi:hypothetical protein
MLKQIVVAGLVVSGLVGTALASSPLTTAPFPGFAVTTGAADCIATNIGTTTGTASISMIDRIGTVLASATNVTVGAGATVDGGAVLLATSTATFCEFTFKGKFKGSFVYLGPSSTPLVVIPATK